MVNPLMKIATPSLGRGKVYVHSTLPIDYTRYVLVVEFYYHSYYTIPY